MRLRWPIGILLCACAVAPGAVRAQTNPPTQPEAAPPAPPAVPAAAPTAAAPATPDATAVPEAAPKSADTSATPQAAQPAAAAQRAPAEQSSSDANATQAPVTTPPATSGPAAVATETTQPPVPATEGAAAETEHAEGEKPTLPWSAALIWRQGYVIAGLAPNAYQTFNPTYTWTFIGLAGYRFDKDTSFSVFQPAVVELTDSATTSTRQELWFLDTILDLSHTFYEMEPVKDAQTLKLGAGV